MEFGESLELSKGFLESEVVSEIKLYLLAERNMKLEDFSESRRLIQTITYIIYIYVYINSIINEFLVNVAGSRGSDLSRNARYRRSRGRDHP